MQEDTYSKTDDRSHGSGLTAYETGRQDIENIIKRFVDADRLPAHSSYLEKSALNQQAEADTSFVTDHISTDATKAFLERLGRELLAKAAEL
jgi:hypothetical protein